MSMRQLRISKSITTREAPSLEKYFSDISRVEMVNADEEAVLDSNSSIQEACEDAGVPFACTEGICGTCVIEVDEGMENLSDYTQEEEDFLGVMGNERLACQCKIKNGTVKISF